MTRDSGDVGDLNNSPNQSMLLHFFFAVKAFYLSTKKSANAPARPEAVTFTTSGWGFFSGK
jgi:hypothetical protein